MEMIRNGIVKSCFWLMMVCISVILGFGWSSQSKSVTCWLVACVLLRGSDSLLTNRDRVLFPSHVQVLIPAPKPVQRPVQPPVLFVPQHSCLCTITELQSGRVVELIRVQNFVRWWLTNGFKFGQWTVVSGTMSWLMVSCQLVHYLISFNATMTWH